MIDQMNTLARSQRRIASIELCDIVKRFPGVIANDHINFQVKSGEVHALLGENGAGKTTLMRILFGLYPPDEGQILVNGQPVRIHSPADSIAQGFGMIHQHFMLVPTLSVAANVALGLKSSRGLLLDLDAVSHRLQQLSELYGLQVDPQAMVWQLSVGEQQRVEILKALYRGADLLILDEPTAVLTPQEVTDFFITLRRMADEGHALIFISHKLHEVLSFSDRVTVLRSGRVVKTLTTKDTTRPELARLMVGREVLLRVDHPPVQSGAPRLQVQDVWVTGDKGRPALKGVSLEVRAGEILGVAGVSGNGQRELAEAIAGLRKLTQGEVLIDRRQVGGLRPDELIEQGLAYISEERFSDGAVKELSVEENMMIEEHGRPPFANGVFLNFSKIAAHTEKLIQDFEIKTPTRQTPLRYLSGGNVQKMIMARELSRKPSVLIAAQPTRGVDIGSTEYIHQRLIAQRQEGTAILLISEDLDEVLNLSDRIAVIFDGRIMGIVDRDDATIEQLGLMMAGVNSEAGESAVDQP